MPSSFVVKKGSKARAFVSASIPFPLSRTVSATDLSTVAVSIVTEPSPAIASAAFTTRFITTCSSWPASALTGGSPSPSRVTTLTRSPTIRSSIGATAATAAFRSTASTAAGRRRLKARSWRVSETARSVARSAPGLLPGGRQGAATCAP